MKQEKIEDIIKFKRKMREREGEREGGRERGREREREGEMGSYAYFYHRCVFATVTNTQRAFATVENTHCAYLLPQMRI